jgi:hypothetical protein
VTVLLGCIATNSGRWSVSIGAARVYKGKAIGIVSYSSAAEVVSYSSAVEEASECSESEQYSAQSEL